MFTHRRALTAIFVAASVACVLLLTMFFRSTEPAPPSNPRYQSAEYTTDERIADLLSHMTLEEKIGQMMLVEKNSITDIEVLDTYKIGALLSGAGAKPEVNTPEGWQQMVHTFTERSKVTRLGIPILFGVDAVHGHGNVPGATIFPHQIGLGASNNESLVRDVAAATSEELRATGILWNYAPNLDLPEDVRWGRVYETFSSDNERAARLGAAYVKGLQSSDSEAVAVLATPKHFTGVGSMAWDTSTNENFRIDQGATPADESKLRDAHLPPFTAAIEAGALSVMVGLNSWGGTKIAANGYLINDVLKRELGFTGFVVSDWYGVYEIKGSKYDAVVTAINAGVDMVMLPFEYERFMRDMKWAVRRGHISEERINDAVTRILRAKFAVGLFDAEPEVVDLNAVGSEEHRALARRAVSESLVLLKNRGRALPIVGGTQSIKVAGSAADNVGLQSGAWTVEWQGVDGNWLPNGTSILAGIKERARAGTRITFSQDGVFENESIADVGIAIVGEKPYAEGWGDRELPILTSEDRAAIERLRAQSRQLVVVIVSGRPLLIENEIADIDALVAAWLPGSEGGGVADVLFGAKPFTGTLPVAWPLTIEQVPVSVTGQTADGTPVLFQRGFGLR